MLLDDIRTRFKTFDEGNEEIIEHKMALIKAILDAKKHPEIVAINFVNTAIGIILDLKDPYAASDLANTLKERADWLNKTVADLVSTHQTNDDVTH